MRRRAALAAAAGVAGVAAAAGPLLDRYAARVESRMNPVTAGPWPAPSDRALALHATLRIADLHADSLLFGRDLLRRSSVGHVDVPRMQAGNLALEVFSMPTKTPKHMNYEHNTDETDDVITLALAKRWPRATWRSLTARALHFAAQAERFAARSDGALRIIRTRGDLTAFLAERTERPSLTAAVLSIEGAHALDDDPANVDVVFDAGVRMISPTHFFDTAFGGSAHGMEQGGLTAKGREMISRMDARGMVLDLAHASAATIDDALAMATHPVVASHTGVKGVCDNSRNLSDEHLAGIAATGGMVGIGFWDVATGGREPEWIARSVAYAVERIGPGHVGLGSDWDGAVEEPFDAANLAILTDQLLRVGLDEASIRLVMGENVLRVLAEGLPA
ncbi:MAG: dipeptidase [Candidatus Limnocylindrales bacterium]